MSKSYKIFNIFNHCLLIALALVIAYPVWHIVCASFSEPTQIMAYNGILLKPLDFSLDAYKQMFEHPLILKSTWNSLFLLFSGTAAAMVMTALGAYVLSVKNVYWSKYINIMVIITMYFGGGLIPTYLLIAKTLGLNNSYLAIILPAMVGVYNMIIMRTSFQSIPESLKEAAEIDGASHLKILTSIILPLSKATLAVIALYYAVERWNSWFSESIYLQMRAKYPLQLVLREILIESSTELMSSSAGAEDQAAVGETIKYSTIVYGTVPILCLYPFLQKYFKNGVMIGAVKG